MSVSITALDKECPKCGAPLQRIHKKSPYIDDYEDECSNGHCEDSDTALRRLIFTERNEAKRENYGSW
jgi:hypothetical protein